MRINSPEEKILREKIENELLYLGYNLSHVGTRYLVEIIELLYNDDTSENLEKNFYPIISEKYNKSINNIKNNIFNATNLMFTYCSNEKLLKYFGIVELIKPSPKLVMFTVLSKIQRNEC